jgi:hypothetical protein
MFTRSSHDYRPDSLPSAFPASQVLASPDHVSHHISTECNDSSPSATSGPDANYRPKHFSALLSAWYSTQSCGDSYTSAEWISTHTRCNASLPHMRRRSQAASPPLCSRRRICREYLQVRQSFRIAEDVRMIIKT